MLTKLINKIKSDARHFYYMKIKRDAVGYARALGAKIGENCNFIEDPKNFLNSEPWLISIGNHVRITYGVRLLTHEGALWTLRGLDDEYKNLSTYKPVYIGDNTMIGMYSIVMPGIRIGKNCIIGAHSVVTKDIPDGTVVVGIPAKKISDIDEFKKKTNSREVFNILNMDQNNKKEYLKEMHPEWFIN